MGNAPHRCQGTASIDFGTVDPVDPGGSPHQGIIAMQLKDSTVRTKRKRLPSLLEKEDATTPIRVLIVDDHPLIRVGIAATLGLEADMEVCGEAATIAQALKLMEQSKPDAVSVDLTLAGEDGIDLIARIHAQDPSVALLIYTMHEEDLWMNRAMEAGAKAYVRKLESPENLVKTIRLLVRSRR